MSTQSLIERLFTAGSHYGFSKSRRHPSVTPFVFGTKQGSDIFDLEKTSAQLEQAKAVLLEAGKNGKVVVLVGTKSEAAKLVRETALALGTPYVTDRWIGGLLTNFSEIRKRFERLKSLQAERESGELERKYTKKERVIIGREIDKLTYNFGGVFNLERIPDLLLVIDPRHDHIAVTEARELKIPVIGVMSSDSNITKVTHPILVNDALNSSISLVLHELSDSYTKGKEAFVPVARPARSERRPRPLTDRR